MKIERTAFATKPDGLRIVFRELPIGRGDKEAVK